MNEGQSVQDHHAHEESADRDQIERSTSSSGHRERARHEGEYDRRQGHHTPYKVGLDEPAIAEPRRPIPTTTTRAA